VIAEGHIRGRVEPMIFSPVTSVRPKDDEHLIDT
jgi:hypothetical protein